MRDTRRAAGTVDPGARGAALVGVVVTTVVISVVVMALVAATMGEATMAADHLHGQQALAAAEAGAWRALAELRRRVRVDLPLRLRPEDVSVARAICRSAGGPPGGSPAPVDLIVRFAVPADRVDTDWTRTGDTAYLSVGTADHPIRVLAGASGEGVTEFYATVAVRWSQRPATCRAASSQGDLERYVVWFDHAVVAVGRAGAARRVVCLRSEGADACARWFPQIAPSWQGSHVRTGGGLGGWPVVVAEVPPTARALLVLGESPVWLASGARIEGSIHANRDLGVAGTPEFSGPVTQAAAAMRFYACGWPRSLEIPDDGAADSLVVPGCDLPRFAASVRGGNQGVAVAADPTGLPGATNPARAALGLQPADGPDPGDQEIRMATTDLPDGSAPVPAGLYVANQCGPQGGGCGGVYIAGTVRRMRLAVEDDVQVLYVTVEAADGQPAAEVRVTVDPRTRAIQVADPGGAVRAYPAGTFNGLVYVAGAIVAPYDPGQDGALDDPDVGLRGVLHPQLHLTIAASGGIAIADHLVYQVTAADAGQASRGLLGLYTRTGDVTIAGPLAPRDLFIDAAILVPQGRLWVEHWDRLPEKGAASVLGAVVQRTLGPLGGFDPLTGYNRVVRYDGALRIVLPPFFPRTGMTVVTAADDGDPAFSGGDPLYGRPFWEELVAR
ncbi:MAG: hypothetical protein QN183_12105 [Armatimonadota bacterium]|nr:hypothetical protein [Armatimonadota bacterium]MDR7532759.1 hypothetical protein [Armatimonadota bacterium]MDR7537093.1 hypothetical protein [Armatimonadota bacterium]